MFVLHTQVPTYHKEYNHVQWTFTNKNKNWEKRKRFLNYFGQWFWGYDEKKRHKCDCMIKVFCTEKETVSRVEKKTYKTEEKLTNHIFDKG